MAVKDIRSNVKQTVALTAIISSDTTTNGAVLDTADFELGLMFALDITAFTDGSYTLLLEEDDVIGFGSSSVISGDQLIGSLPVVAAASVEGADLLTVGVISNKKFVRASIVSTGTTSGATANVIATQVAENMPTS